MFLRVFILLCLDLTGGNGLPTNCFSEEYRQKNTKNSFCILKLPGKNVRLLKRQAGELEQRGEGDGNENGRKK